MSRDLPTAIAAYIAGSNAHDAAACAACFTDMPSSGTRVETGRAMPRSASGWTR